MSVGNQNMCLLSNANFATNALEETQDINDHDLLKCTNVKRFQASLEVNNQSDRSINANISYR
jgi:hypothetical protein